MTKTFDASLQVSWKTGVLYNNGDPEEMQINHRNIKREIFKNQFFKIHSLSTFVSLFLMIKTSYFILRHLFLVITTAYLFFYTLKHWYNLHQHTSIVVKMRINHHFISLETCTICFLIKKTRIFIIVNGEKLPNIRLVNDILRFLEANKDITIHISKDTSQI